MVSRCADVFQPTYNGRHMSPEMTEEQLPAATTEGCFPKFTNTWQHLVSTLSFKHPVYPSDPVAPEHSEFILVDPKIRIRVIHINPENEHQKILLSSPGRFSLEYLPNSKRSSLSEEYWFTKWNKALKIGCNCSFRRSFRFSVLSSQSLTAKLEENEENVSSFDAVPKRIVNVETFVERIIQETMFEAFQEYYILKRQNNNCNINFAYEAGDDETDTGVVLRRKFPTASNNSTNKIVNKQPKISSEQGQHNSIKSPRKNGCVHKKTKQMKPLIMLFHGIGNSSEVWWLVIKSLIKKGYEVVAPDMLGHGYSSAPDRKSAYRFSNLLIHAVTIFDHYTGNDDKRKCILIGHSYGCSLVSALYRHRAPQISQLILISGGGPTPLAAPVRNNEISPFGCIHTLFKPLLFCGLKRSFLFSLRGKHFDVCDPESAIPKQILDYISSGQNWPEGDAAFHRRILVPTLLVHGLQDKMVTLVQQCEMERTMPRAFLELIPNAGHMSMLETPEHLSHMILCFIETWS